MYFGDKETHYDRHLGFFTLTAIPWVAFLEAFGLFGMHKVTGEQACSVSSLLHSVLQQARDWFWKLLGLVQG